MRKRIILTTIGVLLLAVGYWAYSHAFIEVVIENPASGTDLSYTIRNGNQKPSIGNTKSVRFKRLVSRGTHEVLLQQNETSYIAVVKAPGFLSKTTVRAVLSPEKERVFRGDNPGPCMYMIKQVLASAGCNGTFDNLQVHSPAYSSQPTFMQNSPSPIIGSIEGLVNIGGTDYVLIKAPVDDEDQGAPHTLYRVSDGLELSRGLPLSELDENTYYSMLAYKNGFIVHDSAFGQILYYASPRAKPSAISISQPVGSNLKPYSLSTHGSSVVLAYSNNTQTETADIHDAKPKRVKTSVIVNDGNSTRQFDFKGAFLSAQLCGSGKLCLLTSSQLDVYDIAGTKPKLLFALGDVDAIESTSSSLIVVRKNEVISLNVDSQTGAIDYSLGSYRFCGVKSLNNNYVLCLANIRSKKVALFVNRDTQNRGSIDKKIAELLQISEISNVSIYGRFVFIAPNLGELVYDEVSGSYDYDPTVKKDVASKINQKIDELGIDKQAYSIINTME